MTTTNFNTDDNDCDGDISGGNNVCVTSVDNSGNSGVCGYDATGRCITDGLGTEHRFCGSFPTGSLPDDAIISSAKYYFYVSLITKSKGAYDPSWEIDLVTRKDFIGDELTTAHWAFGATEASLTCPQTTGWKNITIPVGEIHVDGDTDICIRPNAALVAYCEAGSKKQLYTITTNEGGANKPYLEIVYTVPEVSGVITRTLLGVGL